MLNWKIRSQFEAKLAQDFDHIFKTYQETLNSPDVGFFHLATNQILLKETIDVYESFKHKKHFIHVGIGGSALGPEMFIKALGREDQTKFTFLNNIDPDEFHRQLSGLNIKDALIFIVSKSGTTAETVAAMSILVNELAKAGIKENDYSDYFVFCTDPVKGDLRKISLEWNVKTLTIPSNIGGRFSVLTPVGFLPMLFAGIDPQRVLKGATEIQTYLSERNLGKDFYNLAFWLKDLHDLGIRQTVLMPYSSRLKEFSAWFVQLWAESLGKNGKGLTPIPAFGATDQHSQMQLFMEGPNDKTLFLFEVEKFQHDYDLKNVISGQSFQLLSPFSLSTLMKAEFEGTLAALSENKRHVVHFKLPEINEESLGQLVLFTECLTALVGKLLDVDPFNQPGVEAGKKYAHEWLKSQGQNR
jgi:glucose-6-phosphate isomerase